MKLSIATIPLTVVLSVALSLPHAEVDALGQSLEECWLVADEFRNTCDHRNWNNFSWNSWYELEAEEETCENWADQCPGHDGPGCGTGEAGQVDGCHGAGNGGRRLNPNKEKKECLMFKDRRALRGLQDRNRDRSGDGNGNGNRDHSRSRSNDDPPPDDEQSVCPIDIPPSPNVTGGGECIKGGWLDAHGHCNWERKLCVRCFLDDQDRTMMRIQTNNMPDHCPGNSLVNVQVFDYEVLFNAPPDPNPAQTFNDLEEATEEVCPLTHCYDGRDRSTGLQMKEYGCDESKRSLAFALNGVAFQNANQQDDDPIYPMGLGDVCDQPLDICMGHNQRNNPSGMYHYHNFSPCLNKNFLNNKPQNDCRDPDPDGDGDSAECEADPRSWALSGYQHSEWKKKRITGISKDGRVLYGPYKNTQELWSPSDVDSCNGVLDETSGDFAYASTLWHPYISGCQGPTNIAHIDMDPPVFPNCSLNGIDSELYNYLSDDPPTKQPTTDQPTTDQPTTGQPTTGQPTTDQPTTGQPTTDQPTTGQPTTDQPTTGQPTTDQPTTGQPTTDQPTTGQPTTDQPTTDQPTTDQPTTGQPTTGQPDCVADRDTCFSNDVCCSGRCGMLHNRCRPSTGSQPSKKPTPAPTAGPTPKPTPVPVGGGGSDDVVCEDDYSWVYETNGGILRDCDWVSKNLSRCDKVGQDGREGREACLIACEIC